MPFDLDELIETEALGKTTVAVALEDLTSKPGFAPQAWQSKPPPEAYGKFSSNKAPVQNSDELQRIVALPRRPPEEPGTERARALIELATRKYGRDRKGVPCRCRTPIAEGGFNRACITELNLTQAWALHEIRVYGGLLGPIGVGHGKTILDLLAPMAMKDCKDVVLLVPPGLVGQLKREYLLVGEHFEMPTIILHGNPAKPFNVLQPDYPDGRKRPVLHILPYSRLQGHRNTVKLKQLAPDFIIADEVHKLRNPETATTSRVLKYFDDHADCRFAGWSGSITDSSIKDYGHLANLALRARSPLPRNRVDIDDWARHIDPVDYPAPEGALTQLGRPGERVIEAFHRRLVETGGIVATTTSAIDCDLSIEEMHAPEVPEVIARALHDLRSTWCRPDGEELLDALSVARTARELACGFHYYWHFPHVNGKPQDTGTILEWLDARKCYRSEMREELKPRHDYLDSPYLLTLAAMRECGELNIPRCPANEDPNEWERAHPKWKSMYWERWRDVKPLVKYVTRANRLDDYLAAAAAEWAQSNTGVVWYDAREFGQWIAELAELPQYGGGPTGGGLLDENGNITEDGSRSVILSLKAHGTGRDGLQQHFCTQLVGQPPPSATLWEQMLGRLHRLGQTAPLVHALFYRHTQELADHVDKALARALYVQSSIGQVQKLRSGFQLGSGEQALDELPEDWDVE
jgi:hypothetical protein